MGLPAGSSWTLRADPRPVSVFGTASGSRCVTIGLCLNPSISPSPFIAAIAESVHAHCPEVGTRRWVGEFGLVVDGPTEPGPNPPATDGGEPRKYGVSRRQSYAKTDAARRLGGGASGSGLGVLLLTGPMSDGPVGFAGVRMSFRW
jgi:hypothetical protein